jgi:nucleoside-diphosphate-sugar epimerase
VILVRLSQVHDTHHQGRIAQHIELARQKGWVAYVGEGKNRLSAVHVSDAARLFQLALEKGQAGAGLKMPVKSIKPEETADYFGWLAGLATIDLAVSSALTRRRLGWNPTGPDLLTDLHDMDYGLVQGQPPWRSFRAGWIVFISPPSNRR